MFTLSLINDDEDFSLDELNTIEAVRDALAHIGVKASPYECFVLWTNYSTSMDTPWAELPYTESELIDAISPYYEIEEV